MQNAPTAIARDNLTDWMLSTSFSGYVAQSETFLQVVAGDWDTVCGALGTSHVELAAHVRRLMGKGSGSEVYSYDVTSLPENTLPQNGTQLIRVTKRQTNGFQLSMFETPEDPDSFNDQWSCTWYLENLRSGIKIMFGANCDPPFRGQVDWIERLGFYEGHTGYRLDPRQLVTLLTGVRADWSSPARAGLRSF